MQQVEQSPRKDSTLKVEKVTVIQTKISSKEPVLNDSFSAVLFTSVEYVANDLRKKWK